MIPLEEERLAEILSSRLAILYSAFRATDDDRLTDREIAAGIHAKTGISVSRSYLYKMSRGLIKKPGIADITAIADFFCVPSSFLVDEKRDEAIDAKILLLKQVMKGKLQANNSTPLSIQTVAKTDLPPIEKVIADRVNRLFDYSRIKTGRDVSNRIAVEKIAEKTGIVMHPSHLWKIRTGKASNAQLPPLMGISMFFNAPSNYLIDRDTNSELDTELEIFLEISKGSFEEIDLRTDHITHETKLYILQVLRSLNANSGHGK